MSLMRNGLLIHLALAAIPGLVFAQEESQAPDHSARTQQLLHALLDQGVKTEQILGIDGNGIPLVCGTRAEAAKALAQDSAATSTSLPSGRRAWECIPSVIRADGVDGFYLEVDTNGPVNGVSLPFVFAGLLSPVSPPIVFRDDGNESDRIAGDFVFTAGPFRYDPSSPLPATYQSDPQSPAGLHATTIGDVAVEELDGTLSEFLIQAHVGILRSDIPAAIRSALAPGVSMSAHLINIRTDLRETQCLIRGGSCSAANLTNPIYAGIPDVVDEFVFFSTYHLEDVPRTAFQNFILGVHDAVRVDWTGTSVTPFDASPQFGSNGVLLGWNVLDILSRGVASSNATHEITHTWAASLDPSLGLTDGSHYIGHCSAASLVGGFLWIDNGDGTFTLNCNEGRNGATQAPPIDRYVAGFVAGSAVSALHNNQSITHSDCGAFVTPQYTVGIGDIQAIHGVRTPGPTTAQHDFRLAFVAESNNRLLTATEMTFYEILSEHYCKPVPPSDPPPYHGSNWVSIGRYWGDNSTWSSLVVRFGDMNADGMVDISDVPGFVSALLAGGGSNGTLVRAGDFDHNGLVDGRDLRLFVAALTAPPPSLGDINGDGRVDVADLGLFVTVLLGSDVNPGHLVRSDLNGDGAADGRDIPGFVRAVLGP